MRHRTPKLTAGSGGCFQAVENRDDGDGRGEPQSGHAKQRAAHDRSPIGSVRLLGPSTGDGGNRNEESDTRPPSEAPLEMCDPRWTRSAP